MCSNSPWYFRQSEMFLFPPFFFCLLALTIPFRMTEVLKCVLCLSWQVTSVWRNNLQSTVTTLSTANKEREHSSHLVPGLTKRSSQVQARHRVWKNVFYAWERRSSCVAEDTLWGHGGTLCFWASLMSVCVCRAKREAEPSQQNCVRISHMVDYNSPPSSSLAASHLSVALWKIRPRW